MAQRLYQQFPKSMIKEVVSLFAKIPVGSTGAVGSLDVSKNMGISSVVRQSAGRYLITLGTIGKSLPDKYNSLLLVSPCILFDGVSAAPEFNVVSEAVQASGQIVVQFSAEGVATDLDSGSILFLEIKVKNSTSV